MSETGLNRQWDDAAQMWRYPCHLLHPETAPLLTEVLVLMPAFGCTTHDPIWLVAYREDNGAWYRNGIFLEDKKRIIHTPIGWTPLPLPPDDNTR